MFLAKTRILPELDLALVYICQGGHRFLLFKGHREKLPWKPKREQKSPSGTEGGG